jgi:Ca-activated chloride channel family protein
MPPRSTRFLLAALAIFAARIVFAVPQPHPFGDGPAEKTLAPQFQVIGADANTEAFPLKSTSVKASISGVIADVIVEQTYANTGKTPIEAIYIFPASTRAAVHGVQMRIGSRVIKSQIQEKEQAKATYEKAKSESKSASLLEQRRPNVFQMSVANIQPGDMVQVTLHYSEKLATTDRVYEFIFPTVVGPRYSDKGSQTEKWVENPYLAEGTASPSSFAMTVNVNAGMPLQSLKSPSHESAKIDFTSKESARVTLGAGDDAGNRDFVLRYQLADQQVASGLLLHEEEGEKFFLLNVQPPARVKPEQIPPRDYVFIVDVSGSMNGFPVDVAKTLMRDLLSGLKPTDTFNVLLFAGSNQALSETPLPATPGNISSGTTLLSSASGSGGTKLLPALKRALAMPQADGVSRSVVVVTDGFVDIEKAAFQLVREQLGRANLFAFGIGSSVNRWLIEGLAAAGQGEPFVVLDHKEATKLANRFREYISSPVLTDIEVRYEGFAAKDAQPAAFPDVFADRPIQVIGKWTDSAKGRIVVKGKTGNAPYEASFDVAAESTKGLQNPALRPLWARERVRMLGDDLAVSRNLRGTPEDSEAKREITTLGLTYELLTEFTSFVGVDETPREVLAQAKQVNQPLPLPQGVNNNAVGGNATVIAANQPVTLGAAPEPGITGLLLMAFAWMLMQRRRRW